MKIDWSAVVRDAWASWKQDREVLIAVAGMLLFAPQLAVLFFVAEAPPVKDQSPAAMQAWAQQAIQWAATQGVWTVVASLVSLFAGMTVFALYLDHRRPPVSGALGHAARLFPRYVLAMILIALPIVFGLTLGLMLGPLLILAVPVIFWWMGRTMLAGPAIIAERPLGAMAAVMRSLRLTNGNGLGTAAAFAAITLSGAVIAQCFLLGVQAMDAAKATNPVAAAILDIGAALAIAAEGLAMVLLQVALYRRLAGSSSGT